MSVVLDSSVTLAWVYANEVTEPVRQLFQQVISDGAWAPSLWRLEVANVLQMGVRRGRHDAAFRDATLADLALLPITTDPDTHARAFGSILRLAERHRLTVYDAAYLELASRLGFPLATLDAELRTAATVESLPLLGL